MTEDNLTWAKLIISALLGGGLASFFNYYAQKFLADWREGKAEQKLAYIYLVKLSYLVAFSEFIKKVVAAITQNVELSKVTEANLENVEMSHKISIVIADGLNKQLGTNEFTKLMTQFKDIETIYKDFIEFKIKEDLLSEMSNNSILEYQLLTQSLNAVKYYLNTWMEGFRNKRPCEPYLVLSTWFVFKKTNEHANKLFKVLLKISGIGIVKGGLILAAQLKEAQEALLIGISKEKIDTAFKKFQETSQK